MTPAEDQIQAQTQTQAQTQQQQYQNVYNLYNVSKGEKPQCSRCKSTTTWRELNGTKHWYCDDNNEIICWDCNQGPKWAEFASGIKALATKKGYGESIRRYMKFLRVTKADDLFLIENPKDIQSQIIEFIKSLKQDGISYATMQFTIAPIFSFYKLHDVILNRKRIERHLGEHNPVVEDNAYKDEQILQALQNADSRMRMILLIEASTGIRVGALASPPVTLGDLTRLPDYGLYKIVFHKKTSGKYYSFTTRECASTGIDNYLLYRQRCGEKISYSEKTIDSKVIGKWEPAGAPLIREQFDMNDALRARYPRPISLDGLRNALESQLVRSGVRVVEHPTENVVKSIDSRNISVRVRKEVAITHGFRKRVISKMIDAGVKPEYRKFMTDHERHKLDSAYFRPTEEQVLQEYLKAEPYLIIDPTMKLQQEVQTLRIEKSKMERLEQKMEEYDAILKKFVT